MGVNDVIAGDVAVKDRNWLSMVNIVLDIWEWKQGMVMVDSSAGPTHDIRLE